MGVEPAEPQRAELGFQLIEHAGQGTLGLGERQAAGGHAGQAKELRLMGTHCSAASTPWSRNSASTVGRPRSGQVGEQDVLSGLEAHPRREALHDRSQP
ncbi:MAG: hypothetical protein ACRDZS_06395 [Acidimicrobiales bacterium]